MVDLLELKISSAGTLPSYCSIKTLPDSRVVFVAQPSLVGPAVVLAATQQV